MKIGLVSHEYPPFPAGGIATYYDVLSRQLALAGHQVHVITNAARFGASAPRLTERFWQEGNLTIHRLPCFDEHKIPAADATFLGLHRFAVRKGKGGAWAHDASNLTAYMIADFVRGLHAQVDLDVIEAPEYFAEAFYIIRRRRSGQKPQYPPVCIEGHTSTRLAHQANGHIFDLGAAHVRSMMLREEYCVQHADALVTPSQSLKHKYQQWFGDRLPDPTAVIPYPMDVPATATTLPRELTGIGPFLLCAGRIEPRKGTDVALKAFARLAEEFPHLRLVLLGREAWRAGESFSSVLERCIPHQHRQRVIRPGNVPRQQAVAAMREAAAVLHPAPWDNYPCTVLEAMLVGGVCVVSDSGGQAEMVEHERSGLIIAPKDPQALESAVRRVLAEPGLRAHLSAGAQARSRKLVDSERILEAKLRVFSAIAEKEKGRECGMAGSVATARGAGPQPHPLPGSGLVLLDAASSDDGWIRTTLNSVEKDLGTTVGWEAEVLLEADQVVGLPEGWGSVAVTDVPPWMALAPSDVVVYLSAGARLDPGSLYSLVAHVTESPVPCGSFLWLRPAKGNVFPYRPDLSYHDLLLGGGALPAAFAVEARELRRCGDFIGLQDPAGRLCALMASAAAGGGLLFQHTGEVGGAFEGEIPRVSSEIQARAIGYLAARAFLPRTVSYFGAVENADYSPAAPPRTRRNRPDLYLRLLRRPLRENEALKQQPLVKFLRRLGLFDLLRRLAPGVRSVIGPD